jgi:hypothetical protein
VGTPAAPLVLCHSATCGPSLANLNRKSGNYNDKKIKVLKQIFFKKVLKINFEKLFFKNEANVF